MSGEPGAPDAPVERTREPAELPAPTPPALGGASVPAPAIDPRRDPLHAEDPERALVPRRPRAEHPDDDDPRLLGDMSFLGHLEELRGVLMRVVVAGGVGAIAGWWFAPRVLEDVIARTVKEAIVLSPLEAFNERFKLAMILGLGVTLPYVLWQIWGFIVPGLFRRERRWIPWLVASSALLFALGAASAYFYVVPVVMQVLDNFLTPNMRAQIQLGSLLTFVYNMAIACGVVFQLPLVTMLITAIGLVTPGTLLRQWRYAIVGSFLVTAMITPGDVVTAQLIMGVPMVLLYFLSVGLSYFVAKRRDASDARDAEASE